MAGAGYKLFNTGDVLTAAQVNTYLMEQTVMVFADAAARTAALSGVVSEGMISYLKDTNAVEVYNGSAWVASDDPNAIQNTIVDAKGDLITATAADTPSRIAVGNNGETLVADSSASTGLRWQGNFAAGKNKFINGNFDIWQRGTSFTNPGNLTFTADRIGIYFDGAGATRTVSRQSNLDVIGLSTPNYFIRFNQSVAGSGAANNLWYTRLEDVSTLAGQTVTVSFYAKAAASTVMPQISFDQNFGSGGSSSVVTTVATNVTVGTSWTRYSYTVSLPSITGKTVGASNYLALEVRMPLNAIFTLDFSQFQVEAGNTATAFQTATGTLAGELAACQRYYFRITAGDEAPISNQGFFYSSSAFGSQIPFKVQMRTAPTSIDFSQIAVSNHNGYYSEATGATLIKASAYQAVVNATGLTGGTTGSAYGMLVAFNAGRTGYVGFNAEL